MCSSEVLTVESRGRIRRAFGVEPFEVYAATETAGIASECERHRLHLFEDLVVTEVVDERNQPVPAGTVGAKVLVTVLFSRTQPLIRYEMTDCVTLSSGTCECGRAFGLVQSVEGRQQDVLELPGAGGTLVSIHPVVFDRALEPMPIRQWQVVGHPAEIVVKVVRGSLPIAEATVAADVARELKAAGVLDPAVRVELVDAIEKTAAGKTPLVRRE
jgi:phenylacetate-coenzyme A ligase PaaK-like adenylate-forming protein